MAAVGSFGMKGARELPVGSQGFTQAISGRHKRTLDENVYSVHWRFRIPGIPFCMGLRASMGRLQPMVNQLPATEKINARAEILRAP